MEHIHDRQELQSFLEFHGGNKVPKHELQAEIIALGNSKKSLERLEKAKIEDEKILEVDRSNDRLDDIYQIGRKQNLFLRSKISHPSTN